MHKTKTIAAQYFTFFPWKSVAAISSEHELDFCHSFALGTAIITIATSTMMISILTHECLKYLYLFGGPLRAGLGEERARQWIVAVRYYQRRSPQPLSFKASAMFISVRLGEHCALHFRIIAHEPIQFTKLQEFTVNANLWISRRLLIE